MRRPAFVEIDGKLYRWRELVARRREQLRAYAAALQPALFELIDDSCPRSQRTAAGRYSEPCSTHEPFRPHHLDGHRLPSLYRAGILAPESPWSNIPRGRRGCETLVKLGEIARSCNVSRWDGCKALPDDQRATEKTKTIAGGGTAATATRSYSQILCNCIASSGAYGAALRREAAVHLG
jgi:hypothetical protein